MQSDLPNRYFSCTLTTLCKSTVQGLARTALFNGPRVSSITIGICICRLQVFHLIHYRKAPFPGYAALSCLIGRIQSQDIGLERISSMVLILLIFRIFIVSFHGSLHLLHRLSELLYFLPAFQPLDWQDEASLLLNMLGIFTVAESSSMEEVSAQAPEKDPSTGATCSRRNLPELHSAESPLYGKAAVISLMKSKRGL